MDTITHALSGMLLARATSAKSEKSEYSDSQTLSLKARLWAGFFAAAFPDSDIVASFFGAMTYLDMHRGITHSVILLPLWAFVLAFLFAKISRNYYHWKAFYFTAFSGIALHIAGDVITAYGTMMLAPLSTMKFAWPVTFIIDFYFSGIILLSIILFIYFKNEGRKIAIFGLVILFIYVMFQALLNHQATAIAQQYVEENKLTDYTVSAMPQPLSPFHWKVVIKSNEKYSITYMNLIGNKIKKAGEEAGMFEKINALYQPVKKLHWMEVKQFGDKDSMLAKKSWNLAIMQSVRNFMLYPSVIQLEVKSDKNCIWFTDHRFILDGVRHSPFVFGACESDDKVWKLYRLNNGKIMLL